MSGSVLVVDDAAFMRRLIRDILVSEGLLVHEAVNGRDAIRRFAETQPGLVTMDISMPVMDGLTALRAIRALDPHARVIMVTAQSSSDVEREALDAGAVAFVTKPFRPEQLLSTVRSVFPVPTE